MIELILFAFDDCRYLLFQLLMSFIISIMIRIGFLVLVLVCLVSAAPDSDKMKAVPVIVQAFRDTLRNTTQAFIQDILILSQLNELLIMCLLSL